MPVYVTCSLHNSSKQGLAKHDVKQLSRVKVNAAVQKMLMALVFLSVDVVTSDVAL